MKVNIIFAAPAFLRSGDASFKGSLRGDYSARVYKSPGVVCYNCPEKDEELLFTTTSR